MYEDFFELTPPRIFVMRNMNTTLIDSVEQRLLFGSCSAGWLEHDRKPPKAAQSAGAVPTNDTSAILFFLGTNRRNNAPVVISSHSTPDANI